jgi:hypothetical protein
MRPVWCDAGGPMNTVSVQLCKKAAAERRARLIWAGLTGNEEAPALPRVNEVAAIALDVVRS